MSYEMVKPMKEKHQKYLALYKCKWLMDYLSLLNSAECVRDLDELNLVKLSCGGFRLTPIFTTAPAASKNDTHFKSGQK